MKFIGALMGLLALSGVAIGSTPSAAVAPEPPPTIYTVSLTGYNAVPEQTKADPTTTATGGPSNPEVVAARSRDLADKLPYGTVISMSAPADEGNSCGFGAVEDIIGYRVIADTMNVRISNTVDVMFDTTDSVTLAGGKEVNAARALGMCDGVTIKVIGFIDLSNPHNLPKTQKELASLMHQTVLATN